MFEVVANLAGDVEETKSVMFAYVDGASQQGGDAALSFALCSWRPVFSWRKEAYPVCGARIFFKNFVPRGLIRFVT